MEIQRQKNCDTVEAFRRLGLKSDYRNYKAEIEALKDLQLSSTIQTFTGNPIKIGALLEAGYSIVKLLKIEDPHLPLLAQQERKTKERKMGYFY